MRIRLRTGLTGVFLIALAIVIQAQQAPPVGIPPPPTDPCGRLTLPPNPEREHEPHADAPPCVVPLQGPGDNPDDPNAPDTTNPPGQPTDEPTGGDPIGIMSGAVKVQETDIVIPCPLLDLVFVRNYHSNLSYDHPLGHRWTHSYNWSVSEFKDTDVNSERGDWVLVRAIANPWLPPYAGAFMWFKRQTDGSYVLSDNLPYRFEKLTAGDYTYKLKIPGGIEYLFDEDGVLQKISHAAGQEVALTYSGAFPDHLLTRVEHDNGQYLAFAYTNVNCIATVSTVSTNLSMAFRYNDKDELVEATRHTVRGDFITAYQYNQ